MGKTWDGARWFEAGIAFFGVAAFLAVGPLRGALTELPGLRLTATLVLFLVPGAWLAHRFLHQHFSGVALLPAAFVVSVSVFALLGVPVLILQGTLENYLWVSGAAVAACLLAAALGAWRGGRTAEPAAPGDHGGLLWAPFLLLVAALAAVSRYNAPSFLGDIWVYLSWIREFLGGAMLASEEPYFGEDVGISRARINGWLLIQTAFSRVSGLDPIDLVFSYMNPALVVVALLAFYALARVLLKSERAALFCGCLYALFFLVHLSASRLGFGGEFAQRLLEDKLAAKFFFLPMALAFAVVFVRGGGRVYGWAFALLCWAVMAIHPIGLAVIGLSMAGFGILHLAANPRVRASWVRISALGLAGLSAIAVPWALVYALTGRPLTAVLTDSDINSGDPDVLRNMVFVSSDRQRIFELADGSYIMHPSLLLDPIIAIAFLLGVPFLLWRAGRSVAAQLLLGMLLLTTVVVYVPPIATFMGEEVVLPGQIWRLAWPIPLAAVVALGWLLWEAMDRVATWLGRLRWTRPLGAALPLLLVVALMAAAAPRAAEGVELIRAHNETTRAQGYYPPDPIFPWFRDEVESPVVVLAPDLQGARIPAYSSEANVVSRRGTLVLRVLPKLEERAPGQIEVPQGARRGSAVSSTASA